MPNAAACRGLFVVFGWFYLALYYKDIYYSLEWKNILGLPSRLPFPEIHCKCDFRKVLKKFSLLLKKTILTGISQWFARK